MPTNNDGSATKNTPEKYAEGRRARFQKGPLAEKYAGKYAGARQKYAREYAENTPKNTPENTPKNTPKKYAAHISKHR